MSIGSRGAISAAEKDRGKSYTAKQKKFLKVFADNNFKDARECALKAGYTAGSAYAAIMSLKTDIVEISNTMLLGAAPEAAGALLSVLSGYSDGPGNKDRLAAAKEVLDRVGIVKPETVNHNHQVAGGLFLIPAKAALPQQTTIDVEYEEEDYEYSEEDYEYEGECGSDEDDREEDL